MGDIQPNSLPGWVTRVNLCSLLLYWLAIVAYLTFALVAGGGLLQIVPLFTLGSREPGTFLILLIALIFLVCILPLPFSLLPHTTTRSLTRAYRQGGSFALKEEGLPWGIAIFAQVLSWASLVAFIVFLPKTPFFQLILFGTEDVKTYAEGVNSVSANMIRLLIAPFSMLFIPGCLRLAPLVFFFRKMRGPENA